MAEFFESLASFYTGLFNKLSSAFFVWSEDSIYGLISLGSILFVAIVIRLAVSVFWKGAKG